MWEVVAYTVVLVWCGALLALVLGPLHRDPPPERGEPDHAHTVRRVTRRPFYDWRRDE